MDVTHQVCQHLDHAHKMQRLYKRVNGKFVACAWMCPDCGQIQRDRRSLLEIKRGGNGKFIPLAGLGPLYGRVKGLKYCIISH